jgi:uncharacterized membrane protein YGL010W
MKNLEALLNEYAESHQNRTNLKIHMVCVPLIEWSLLGLLFLIPHPWPGALNWAHLFALAAMIYYLQFGNSRAFFGSLAMAVVYLGIIDWIVHHHSHAHSAILFFAVFAVAWVGQFIGHHIEGKKPSFFKDLFFLLIGPLWVLEEYLQIFHLSLRQKKS